MTDRRSGRLSEFTWYSRLAAWIGAAMLLVQSVLGRDAGFVTALAVCLLGIGFLCFLVGVAVDGRALGAGIPKGARPAEQLPKEAPDKTPGTSVEAPSAIEIPGPDVIPAFTSGSSQQEKPGKHPASRPEAAAASSGTARRPKFRERAKKTESRPERQVEAEPERARPAEPVPAQFEPDVHAPPVGVETELLNETSVSVGAECPRCGISLRVGQLSVGCPVCGWTHHAVCWMENKFHCGTPDCTGHGSLEEPATSQAADEATTQ